MGKDTNSVLDDYFHGLLCAIFGDAGKHRNDVGDAQAVEDAHAKLADLLRENLHLSSNKFTPVQCGCNHLFPAARLGCGEFIDSPNHVYRCVDCDTPFHKHCLHKHCKNELGDLQSKIKLLQEANEILGPWMSAALEDPKACKEFKMDIEKWFAVQSFFKPTSPVEGEII